MPFTTEQFLEVFKNYNLGVWPMQIVLYLMGLLIVFYGTKKTLTSNSVISWLLAFLWLWMGVGYHLSFFTAINKAAYLFGTVFIVQGWLFFSAKNKIVFQFQRDIYGITGAILVLFAMVIYPVWGHFTGHVYPASPTFGLPCPTTIFTLGILLWANQKWSLYLWIIPLIWSLIGFVAALSLGIIEDTGLLVSGVVAACLFLKQKGNG